MKSIFFSLLACAAALGATPVLARADLKPNFDEDAKPILSQQSGLIQYVESRFEVKDTGIAKVPGNDERAPQPPYIFRARTRGSNGPYNYRLLIQPGSPGHILGVVKDAPAAPKAPVATVKTPALQPSVPAPQAPAASEPIPSLTADTPSGPITNTPPPDTTNTPGLAPPPDPAPTPH